jgi:hypothetical protein
MDKQTVLDAIDKAFGHLPRPAVMGRNPDHCDECADHEAVMQAHTPETISLEEVGNPGWDPVCFITDEAFAYFMPGFARLTVDDDYIYSLLFHLGKTNRIQAFNSEQRGAVAQLMKYVAETMPETLSFDMDKEMFDLAMNYLAGTASDED